jgi:hypothetical protein
VKVTDNSLAQSLGSRLREIAQQRTELDVTQLQIINIGEIRSAFGEKWSEARARVYETSVGFLKRRIAADDLLIPCGNGFIVIFGSLEGAGAEVAGLQLTRALNSFFLGQDGLKQFRFSCRNQTLEIDGIDNLVQALSLADDFEMIEGTLADESSDEILFRYQPVWDAKREVIAAYLTTACNADGAPLEAEDPEYHLTLPRQGLSELDLAMIDAGTHALERSLRAGTPSLLGLTVHSAALADKVQRAEILARLGRIDKTLQKYLFVRLVDIVPGFPRFQLEEQLRLLGQKIERVCVELHYYEPDLDGVRDAGVWACSYKLPRMLHPTAQDTAHAITTKLERDARRVQKSGKRLIVDVPEPPLLVNWCRAAGVDYVSSLPVWPVVDAPQGIQRFDLKAPSAA